MSIRLFAAAVPLILLAPVSAQPISNPDLPPVTVERTASPENYADVADSADRASFTVSRLQRGTTKLIPQAVIVTLCGDRDGCSIRMGMHNWDETQRVASREFLFFNNPVNRNWRSSYGDAAGTNADNVVAHPGSQIWSCYFTDGEYNNWVGVDSTPAFGLLSWNQYNADCWMTIID